MVCVSSKAARASRYSGGAGHCDRLISSMENVNMGDNNCERFYLVLQDPVSCG